MIQAPLFTRAAISSAMLRWSIALASAAALGIGFAAYRSARPLAYLALLCADIVVAALATHANEATLDTGQEVSPPAPEELVIHACLHCGVIALLLLMSPGSPLAPALLAVHQVLLFVTVRRLPAA